MTPFVRGLPSIAPLELTKHVRFTLGMVLGVDDFDQEFGYLSARSRRVVRELAGYGVVTGLALSVEAPAQGREADGPRLQVSAGTAVLPSGQLVAVPQAQCAALGAWARSVREQLAGQGDGQPPSTVAAVVLRYAECLTDDVPIPGEPCRTEAELMAPSRVQDSFALELRLQPPAHLEDLAVRRFAAWLTALPVRAPGSSVDDVLDAARAAAGTSAGLEDFLVEPPPPGLALAPDGVPAAWRALLGLWATEWRGRVSGAVPGADPPPGAPVVDADDVLLLGEVTVPLVWDAVSGDLLAGEDEQVSVDLARRPALTHLRLLAELLLAGREPAGADAVEAVVRVDAVPLQVVGDGLEVDRVDDRVFHLVPAGFDPTAQYAVTGSGLARVADASSLVFDRLDPDDPDLAALLTGAGITRPGVTVRVRSSADDPPALGFSVRVRRLPAGPA